MAQRILRFVTAVVAISSCSLPAFAQFRLVQMITGSGTVEAVYPIEMIIRQPNGEKRSFLIQDKDGVAVPLTKGKVRLRFPATVKVTGDLGEFLKRVRLPSARSCSS